MSSLRNVFAAAACGASLLAVAPASAATVTLDFESPVPAPLTLHADTPGIMDGNCADRPCLAVNKVGAAVLSITAPLTFTVTSFWFHLQGKKDDMIVTTDKGSISLTEALYPHNNGGQILDVSLNSIFQDITSLSFLMTHGTGRVDDIAVNYPAPVPLPATGLMLMGALGGIAALRRKKQNRTA